MVINFEKSGLFIVRMPEALSSNMARHFKIPLKDPEAGLKYLGFNLESNKYQNADWHWLVDRIERRVTHWCNRWISRGGRLVLVKAVIEAIPVYWHILADIPKGILIKIKKTCASYLWKGSLEYKGAHLAHWSLLAKRKIFGG